MHFHLSMKGIDEYFFDWIKQLTTLFVLYSVNKILFYIWFHCYRCMWKNWSTSKFQKSSFWEMFKIQNVLEETWMKRSVTGTDVIWLLTLNLIIAITSDDKYFFILLFVSSTFTYLRLTHPRLRLSNSFPRLFSGPCEMSTRQGRVLAVVSHRPK